MASNVYTKNEILQSLASKGYFIDAYTLDTFFDKWKVEAIFEDEQGSEFYDKNALDLVMENLFSSIDNTPNQEQEEPRVLSEPDLNAAQQIQQPQVQPQIQQPQVQQQFQAQPQPQIQQPQVQQQFQTQNAIQPQQIAQQQMQQMPQQQQMPYQQYPQQMQMQQPYAQQQMQMPYQQYPQQMQMPYQQYPQQMQMQQPYAQQQMQQQDYGFNDLEATNILNNISLSDGSSLMSKVQDTATDAFVDYEQLRKEAMEELGLPDEPEIESIFAKEEKKIGILEGAMQAANDELSSELGKQNIELEQIEETPIQEEPKEEEKEEVKEEKKSKKEEKKEEVKTQILPPGTEVSEFDDVALLNESLEAQERFREYVVSELSKKNFDVTPKGNEFKLDISEKTINMVARSMAKKIAAHVSKIFANNNNGANSAQLAKIQEENKKLEQKTKDLEDQIKKLRMLLAESNKNLNSYKPSIFGLYKKVPPGQ